MENIILIGMPASGKSTVGVILAKTLGIDFLDTDIVLQKQQKRTLQDMIEADGLSEFLKAEESAVLSVQATDTVIATGGSVVYSERAVSHLKESGKVVYLSLPFDEIDCRLTNIKTRGVAKSPEQTLLDIYKSRAPLYEKYADIRIDCTDLIVEQTVERILEQIIDLSGKEC